jgi:N-acetylglutamate synthase-like GNAT family acetyltransferase
MTPDDVQIIRFASRHVEAWRTLNEAWIERYFAIEPKDRAMLDDPEGKVIDMGGLIFIAERQGEPVGCAALLKMDDGGFELAKMAVADQAKGMGIGRNLINTCIAAARKAGAHRVYLETNSSLGPALSLYRSAGFIDLPPASTPYARCDVWMELRF